MPTTQSRTTPDFTAIDENADVWETINQCEDDTPRAHRDHLLAGWITTDEIYREINDIRRQCDLVPLEHLGLRWARRIDPERCLFAMALRAYVKVDTIVLRSEAYAERIEQVLGYPRIAGNVVEAPRIIVDCVNAFDTGLLESWHLARPRNEQLSFEWSPVAQAEDLLRSAMAIAA
jgi:hypothetical protein